MIKTRSNSTHHMALVEPADEAKPHLMKELVEAGGGPLVAATMWQPMAA